MVFKLSIATVAFAPWVGAQALGRLRAPTARTFLAMPREVLHGYEMACGTDIPPSQCCAFFALRDDLQENLFEGECGEDGLSLPYPSLVFNDLIFLFPVSFSPRSPPADLP